MDAQAIEPETGTPPAALIVNEGEVPEFLQRQQEPGMQPGAPVGPWSPPSEPQALEVDRLSVAASGSSVDLRPNVLRGTGRLTNQNPDILALLAADPWHTNGYASAYSTSPSGFNADTYTLNHTSPTEFTFEMLVEAAAGGENGVVYSVSASRGWGYSFPSVPDVRVKPRNLQPEPTEVTLESCVGVVQIKLGEDESCQTSPAWAHSPWVSGLSTFSSEGYLTGYVRGSSSYKTNLYYYVNTPAGQVRTWVPVEWSNVQCDQVVRLCAVPQKPPTPEVGSLTGPFEVLGESLKHYRYLGAYSGPDGSSGGQSVYGAAVTAPLSEPDKWWKLSSLRAGSYRLYATGFLREGRQLTYFDTPVLSPWTPGGAVTVVKDQTTTLTQVIEGETRYPFIMRPSYFYGAVRLADPYVPLHPGSTSTLQTLYFEGNYDNDGDGIPNDPWIDETRLYASSSAGGGSSSAFPGQFEPGTGELASNYEQVLPHTYDLPYTWNQYWLKLRFWSEGESLYTRPDRYDPERFRNGWLYLTPRGERSKLMNPEERFRIDHEYCFNEVQFFLRTELGRFINPSLDVSGSFTGTDWQERPASYSVSGTFYGNPYDSSQSPSYAQSSGLLSMTLPQGSYTLRPSALMVNDSGGTNSASFAPVNVSLGCGQRLKLVPPLAVVVDPINRCASGASVPVSGVVKSSPAQVDRIWYQVNGGPEVELCTDCGTDPAFSFTAELQSCENTVQVFAFTEGLPAPATGSQQVVWDDPADGPSCPGTYCLNRPPVARCKSVTVPANESCTGGCGSVDDGSYDPDVGDTVTCTQTPDCPFSMGTQRVTLTCTDTAGNSTSCEASVTVKDLVPPTIACPAEPLVLACQDGGAQSGFTPTASDNCGSVITACSPSSGTTFPVGTTATVCTAFDEAGNRASCAFDVAVVDDTPPEVTCPEPFTVECGGSDLVTPPDATATDACLLASVEKPPAASFPLGTTPLTYTATDASGLQATCTTSLTVQDTQAPTLALQGGDTLSLECGVDTYTEPGAVASDVCAGDLSAQVRVSGSVNPYVPGSYTLTYSVEDSAGHATSATRTVDVVKGPTNCCGPNAGHFTPTASGTSALHLQHTATSLPDGRVLVVGGWNPITEVYDPLSGTWAFVNNSLTTHRLHTATLLADGRVLVAGGDGASSSASAEVYDPVTGMWTATGNLLTHRREHAAVRLADGRVLVMGGRSAYGSVLASAEVYDPASGTWTATGSMAHSRRAFTATLLPDGRVLVAGGLLDGGDECGGSNCRGSAEVYDPASGTWSFTGDMATPRGFHSLAVLADGTLLVSGGSVDGRASARAEVYDPASGAWTATGDMLSARRRHTLTPLPNGLVLAVGGYDAYTGIHTTAELYNPLTGSWCTTGAMDQDRYEHTATLLPDGRVLITAGFSNASQYTAEVYDFGG